MCKEILEALRKPIDPSRVKWRVGAKNSDKTKGLALAYVDARVVQDRLDEVMGAANWQTKHLKLDDIIVCELGLRINGEWIWKSNGAGMTEVESEKGACSDAFKRVAVDWGIGRELYALVNIWVLIEPMGRSHKIKQSESGKLDAALKNNAPQHETSLETKEPEPEEPKGHKIRKPTKVSIYKDCVKASSAEKVKDFLRVDGKLKYATVNVIPDSVISAMHDHFLLAETGG